MFLIISEIYLFLFRTHVTLISPRRMGKTGLIKNVFYYIQKENKSAACFYLDIFSTQNLQEFVSLLGRSEIGRAHV